MIHEIRSKQRSRVRTVISMPFIYGMIIPLAFLDFSFRIYQGICFPLYGIPLVERKLYTRYDRHKLPYLDWLDKLHCHYCMYANGTINYVKDVLKQTEIYWCPIRNKLAKTFKEPDHHKDFAPYNNKTKLQEILKKDNPPT